MSSFHDSNSKLRPNFHGEHTFLNHRVPSVMVKTPKLGPVVPIMSPIAPLPAPMLKDSPNLNSGRVFSWLLVSSLDDSEKPILADQEESAAASEIPYVPIEPEMKDIYYSFAKYSVLIGLQDIVSDLDTYAVYYYYIDTIGCNFFGTYGILLTVHNVAQLIWWPILGVVVDSYAETNLSVLVWTNRIGSFVMPCLLGSLFFVDSIFWGMVLLNARWILSSIVSSCSWKLLKIEVDTTISNTENPESAAEIEENMINYIGTQGAFGAQFMNAGVFLGQFIAVYFFSNYFYAKYLMYAFILFIGFLVFIASCLIFVSDEMNNVKVDSFKPISILSIMRESTGNILFLKNPILYLSQSFRSVYSTFSSVFTCPIMRKTFFHFFALTLVQYLVYYPVGLYLTAMGDITDSGPCSGLLFNLIFQGGITQVGFLVVGLFFYYYASDQSYEVFYGWLFPFFGVCSTAYFFVVYFYSLSLNVYVLWSLLAVVNAIVFYSINYDYYVLSTWTPQKYSGFVQSCYWMATQILSIGPGAVLASDVPVNALIMLCIVATILSVMQSLNMKTIFMLHSDEDHDEPCQTHAEEKYFSDGKSPISDIISK